MFPIEELTGITLLPQFTEDRRTVLRTLATSRVGQQELFSTAAFGRLRHFVECVIASAPDWEPESAHDLCRVSGEIAEALSIVAQSDPLKKKMRLRSALLFELADLPAISSALVAGTPLAPTVSEFFTRRGAFGTLKNQTSKRGENGSPSIVELALSSDVFVTGEYLQGREDHGSFRAAHLFEALASELALDYSASEVRAFEAVLNRRMARATRNHVESLLFEELQVIQFPSELWYAQEVAITGGLIDEAYDSFGLAAPTGTGKSFLARLLIVEALRKHPDSKVLYMVPSRALVYEVASRLSTSLQSLGIDVIAVTPQLLEMDEDESSRVGESQVIVLTPEKADMLLRLGEDFFSELCVVIVDEAHHIESSTRGILLEMYLWRLKRLVAKQNVRFVFLSAVAPNIGEIANWVGANSKSVLVEQRPTRMRAGVYRVVESEKKRSGVVEYIDGVSLTLVPQGKLQAGSTRQLIQLAYATSEAGPVLIVAKGKKECEKLATAMLAYLGEDSVREHPKINDGQKALFERLDSRLEREMYAEVALRKLLKFRIAYHHAGLPPRVRTALEDAIRENLIDYVFATTTLAEGVNFPFSTVIVQSLALREQPQKGRPARYQPVTPRVFWNIAGRAGRPGFDREGQVLLFEPTLGLDKVNYVIGDYLNAKLTATAPVKSALADALDEISSDIECGELSSSDLTGRKLPETVSKRVQGAVNLIRVSLVHARASGLKLSPEEILESSFAAKSLSGSQLQFARGVFASQEKLVTEFLADPLAPDQTLVAELGLSIETLSDLSEWISQLEEWQIKGYRRLITGGIANLEQAQFLVGPVAKRMAELEGPRLGGFLSEVIVSWISGAPFASIRAGLTGGYYIPNSIEDLISVVYSRIQYLLPWGLYATDRLVETEAKNRAIPYNNEIRSLAYLVDAGVPSFDALRLVDLELERTDAARIAAEYHRRGGLRLGVEIVPWLVNQSIEQIGTYVRGLDQRKLDYDMGVLVQALRTQLG